MHASSFRLVFVFLVLFPLTVRAHQAKSRAPKEITIEALKQGVVRIENTVADMFEPDPDHSHGTGFIVKPGFIYTNSHVIERGPMDAQRLLLHFNVPQARPEAIRAQVIFDSPLHDFAVLQYDPSQLKRAKPQPLRLPAKGSFFYNFLANEDLLVGRHVLTMGNPYDSKNMASYGMIAGIAPDPTTGHYIQTQTPINPGNSGGPPDFGGDG